MIRVIKTTEEIYDVVEAKSVTEAIAILNSDSGRRYRPRVKKFEQFREMPASYDEEN